MDRKLWEQLPVYRRLEEEVKNFIAVNQLKRHDRLPSESQLAEQYGASIGTVRKALNNLVSEKIIYRRHGQGTFVAPRSRKGRILVIPGLAYSAHDDYTDFLFSALDEANQQDLPCEPVLVSREDFLENIEDVKMVYPEVAGVIFFRRFENLQQSAEALRRQNLPFVFYGANIHECADRDFSTFFHDESQIAKLLADYYEERHFRRVATLYRPSLISEPRQKLLTAELKRRGIENECFEWPIDDQEMLRDIAKDFDVLHCTISYVALEVLQYLERELGLRIPRDAMITGVDDLPACQLIHPSLTVIDLCNGENGRRCLRRFCEQLTGDGKCFHLTGKLKLIQRESC